MKILTATAARRRFGALIKEVQNGPVLVVRRDGAKAVFVSTEEYKRIRGITNIEPTQTRYKSRQ